MIIHSHSLHFTLVIFIALRTHDRLINQNETKPNISIFSVTSFHLFVVYTVYIVEHVQIHTNTHSTYYAVIEITISIHERNQNRLFSQE